MTGRRFSIKLRYPLGAVFSSHHVPTRGVPQGGVLSPLLWLLHVNRIIEGTLQQIGREIDLPPLSWNVIVQMFADDISAAIGHELRSVAVQLSHILVAVLLGQLGGNDLDVSRPKCQNFLVEGCLAETAGVEPVHEGNNGTKEQLKEQNRRRMSQDLEALEAKRDNEGKSELPFPWSYSFRLLGVFLDCH